MNIFRNILISCLRQSHNKVFDFSALETKSSETQKKVHQLEKQLSQAQKDLQKIKRESDEKDSIIEEQGVTLAMDCANEKGSNNTKIGSKNSSEQSHKYHQNKIHRISIFVDLAKFEFSMKKIYHFIIMINLHI